MDAEALLGARRIFVPANGVIFEVFEAGEGERLALLLHGFPETAVMWRHLVAPLVAKGYRVWAVNQRGYGATSRPKGKKHYSLSALTGDVAGLIDASGARSITLISHDWGGVVAWVAAIRRLRPLERLVFINIPHPLCFWQTLQRSPRQRRKSFYVALFQIPVLPDWLLSLGRGYLTAALIRNAARRPDAICDDAMDIYRDNAASPGAMTAMLNWYRRALWDAVAARAALAAPIETPTLIVWGLRDVALDRACLEGTDRYVANLRIERLPGVSHFSPEDAPQKLASIINDFL
ncbi:alpha/beta fold hydrolase [Methylocystis sp. MJC1]|jgi:pimeloyl-ACP methyl ester carboxylesterase|uniref:alpha/beta fold hydrolase n=1 Tax=Methylocystis sp. MJC1 TaxID=2654282 RepID=UPI0013EC74E0|nr:alpha/beta fold hydrolase [Methylocystis sp. MJC1]KAF2990908.1 Fluoroacetate dehalogenase [Methylocystis sp. MJC1]MBU6527802.1 alpha/beta fold hydrolase [Methylocystis sp. MJC1]UZX10730.1 alpha/beta fold hydrolase [Methylocystis sp. MJC1]